MSAAEICHPDVEDTGDTLRPDDGQEDVPRFISIAEASSTILRELHKDLGVRNIFNGKLPEVCAPDTDWFCAYLESHDFESLTAACGRYLRDIAEAGDWDLSETDPAPEVVKLNVFNIDQSYSQSPISCRILSYFGIPLYGDWNSGHLWNLHRLELSGVIPEDQFGRGKVVLRTMVAAVMELEDGVPIFQCQPARALGAVSGNARPRLRRVNF